MHAWFRHHLEPYSRPSRDGGRPFVHCEAARHVPIPAIGIPDAVTAQARTLRRPDPPAYTSVQYVPWTSTEQYSQYCSTGPADTGNR